MAHGMRTPNQPSSQVLRKLLHHSDSGMREIGIIINGSKPDSWFWAALAESLTKESDLHVYKACSKYSLERILRQHQSHVLVLILEVSQGRLETAYKHYFDLNPKLMIIGLDPGSTEAIMSMRDLGRDLLLRLIRAVSSEQPDLSDKGGHPRLRLLTSDDVEKLATGPIPHQRPENVSGVHSEIGQLHMDNALRWLDLCLHERLARETETDGEISTPGWTITATRARALLNGEHVHKNQQELQQAREELEATIIGREDTVDGGFGASSRLQSICNAFKLDSLDRQILIMALAPELDGRYARVFGFLNDDLTRRRPTATLLAQLILPSDAMGWDIRERLTNSGALARYRLLMVDRSDPLPGSEVALLPAPEIQTFLLTCQDRIPEYAPYLQVIEPVDAAPVEEPSTTKLRDKLLRWREIAVKGEDDIPIIQLVGDQATRQWFQYAALCAGDTIVVFDLGSIEEHRPQCMLDNCLAAARVAVLHDAILLVTGRSSITGGQRDRFDAAILAELHPRVSQLAVHDHATWLLQPPGPVWLVERAKPGVAERAAIWRDRARAQGLSLTDADARAIASTVKFQEPEIDATLRLCGAQVANRHVLQTAVRHIARTAVPSTVRRLEATFGWDDIVLPDGVLAQLHQIPAHVHHAGEVLEDWGYRSRMPYGQGIAALFSGPSGTGKTMAAQIIAGELGVDLFQVDLAKTVSKYIGETEKNLDTVFEAAEKASAVLLFDEADALFGKRTEVRDAHDRYANIEVAYLLQRMEAYTGLAILTTNFRQNLDSAFMRRLRFVVEFPTPEANDREAIWQHVFPSDAQLAEDVSFTFLARRLNLTGGHIQQIAIRAAFAAVVEGDTIAMRHIVHATREELGKLGMLNAEKTLAELAA